ncbi:DNA polymerase III subunit tau [Methylobacterium brachiatum]|nr:DNA polymerase III subunit tau [Methylobacterium brachiatum]
MVSTVRANVVAWPERHRPQRFDRVAGLSEARAGLQGLLRQKRYRSVLLHGPSGTGKTTLAELYATAILCGAGDEPCRSPNCSGCAQGLVREDNLIRRWTVSAQDDAARAAEISANLRYETLLRRQGIVLIDGADRLHEAVTDALHARTEHLTGVTFIACARDLDRVPARFASLFLPLPVPSAPIPDRLAVLERICAEEGLAPEAGALDLIARCAEASLRAMIRDLEVLCQAPLTALRVRAHYGLDVERPAQRYLAALLSGVSFDDQLTHLEAWLVPPGEQARAIEQAVCDLFRVWVGSSDAPALWLRRARARADLAEKLEQRAAVRLVSPRLLWQAILEVWERGDHVESEAGLLRRLSITDDLVNGQGRLPQALVSPTDAPASAPPVSEARPPSINAPVQDSSARATRRYARKRPAEIHLSGEDARHLIDAASFLVQAYGLCLNTRFTIRHTALGACAPEAISQRIERLQRELRKRYRGPSAGGEGVQFLYVHGRDQGGPFTRVVATLPGRWAETERWLREKFLPRQARGHTADGALEFERGGAGGLDDDEAMRVHLAMVRWLCRGLDPAALADEADADAGSLVDALALDPRSSLGERTTPQRCGVSRRIDVSARASYPDDGLPILYATRPGGATYLARAWEMREFRYRAQCRLARPNPDPALTKTAPMEADGARSEATDGDIAERAEAWRVQGPVRRSHRPMAALDERLEVRHPRA